MDLNLHPSWEKHLSSEFKASYMQKLMTFLEKEEKAGKKIYPPKKNVFEAFRLTSFDDVKVVIIGQDPYHGEGQAHGLCFSVQKDVKVPPSLVNIFKELKDDLGIEIPQHGCLENWAKQGVLLLNNVLTVEEGKAGSHHQKGWEKFTDKVIDVLNKEKDSLVFILWGSPAQKKAKTVDEKKHLVLKSVHPSPLSVYRGFLGSKPFSQTNKYLKTKGLKEISWTLAILFFLTSCLPSFDRSVLNFEIKDKTIALQENGTPFEVLKARVLTPHCIGCHKGASTEAGIAKWVKSGRLYGSVKEGKMPKNKAPLGERELSIIQKYMESLPKIESAEFKLLKEKILTPHCIKCHKAMTEEQGLAKYIKKENLEASPLYVSIKEGRMPKKASPLLAPELKIVRDYLTSLESDRFLAFKKKILIPHCISCHKEYEFETGVLDYVAPRRPEESKLYQEVEMGRMPQEGELLTPEELEEVKKYILGTKPISFF